MSSKLSKGDTPRMDTASQDRHLPISLLSAMSLEERVNIGSRNMGTAALVASQFEGAATDDSFSVAQFTGDFTDVASDPATISGPTADHGVLEVCLYLKFERGNGLLTVEKVSGEMAALKAAYALLKEEFRKSNQAHAAEKAELESTITSLKSDKARLIDKNDNLADKVQDL